MKREKKRKAKRETHMFKRVKKKKIKDYDPNVAAWQREDKDRLETDLLHVYPKPGENIKIKEYFAVKDYERALFYNKGQLIGILSGGVYELEKKARIKGTEIVWIDISLIDIPWGIPVKSGIITKDGYTIGLYGDLKLKISDVKMYFNSVVAGKKEWKVQDLKDWIKSLLHTSLRDIFKQYDLKDIILEDRERVLNLVTSKITEEFVRYGLDLETFNILGDKVPQDVREILEFEMEKSKAIEISCKEDFDKCIDQKRVLQARIDEFRDRITNLQDQRLNGDISREEFEQAKIEVEEFMAEAEEELKAVDDLIKSYKQ